MEGRPELLVGPLLPWDPELTVEGAGFEGALGGKLWGSPSCSHVFCQGSQPLSQGWLWCKDRALSE